MARIILFARTFFTTLLFIKFCISPSAAQTTQSIVFPDPILLPAMTGCGSEPMDSVAAYYQPYFGNNQYLLDLVSEVEGTNCTNCRTFTGGLAAEAYKIPVRVWVYQNDQGVGGPTNDQVELLINLMNERLRTTNVSLRFYLKSTITRVPHTGYYEKIDGKNTGFGTSYGSTTMMTDNIDRTAFNIHIIRRNNDGFAGTAIRPDGPAPYSFAVVTENFDTPAQMAITMVHEAGHCFDLSHTHESARNSLASNNANAHGCYQESVSRTRTQGFGCFGTLNQLKCSVNGDLLCDTDADPELNFEANVGSLTATIPCDYTGGGKDRWGDAWTPPTRNIMSYSRRDCRTQFTPMQRGVIYHYIREYKTKWEFIPNGNGFVLIPPERRTNPSAFYINSDVDRYENDNYSQQANTILYDESQLHSFHKQPGSTAADVDWVSFVANSTTPLIIRTSAVGAAAQPNTRLTLFGSDGITILATNDDLSASNVFSRITTNSLTTGSRYFVRVENMGVYDTPAFTGQYYLSLFSCLDQVESTIQGNSRLCLNSANNVFSVVGLPAGTTVTWTVEPANSNVINLLNNNGSTATISALNIGNAILTATVNVNGCTTSLSPLTITVGGPLAPDVQWLHEPDICDYNMAYYRINNYDPSSTYTITNRIMASGPSINGSTFWVKSGAGVSNGSFTLTVSNSCGSTSVDYEVIYPPCNYPTYTYTLSPNPANGEVTVEQHFATTNSTKTASSQTSNRGTTDGISEVQVYDQYGRLRLTQLGQGTTVHLQLNTLPTGLYVVYILRNQTVVSRQQLQVGQ